MNFSLQGQGLEIDTKSQTLLPRRLRPIHTLEPATTFDFYRLVEKQRSFYNAVWQNVRDRHHPGGNFRMTETIACAIKELITETTASPQFPYPLVEFFQQWIAPDSELRTCTVQTIARIAVDAFYAEKAAFEADPTGYRERLRRDVTNSTSAPGEPAH